MDRRDTMPKPADPDLARFWDGQPAAGESKAVAARRAWRRIMEAVWHDDIAEDCGIVEEFLEGEEV